MLRLSIIQKVNPDHWRKISLLDSVCSNPEVTEDVKKWTPYLLKVFRTVLPDLTLEDVKKTFLLPYVNAYGFHLPGNI